MDFEIPLIAKDAALYGIKSLLDTYRQYTTRSSAEIFVDNEEYMKITEMFFVVKNLRDLTDANLYAACYKTMTLEKSVEEDVQSRGQQNFVDTNQLVQQLEVLDKLLESIRAYRASRLGASLKKEDSKPRIVKMCEAYKFSQCESDLFHLVVVMQGSNNSHVLNSLIELDYLRKIFKFQRLASMSEVDLQMFCEHEKAHIKEGIVTVEEDNGLFFNLKVQQVAVQLFYGKKVRSDDLLKISQTGLEGILASEITSNGPQDVTLTGGTDSRKKRPRDMEVGDSVELDDADDADGSFVSTPARKNLRVSYSGHSSRTPISHAGSSASNPSPSSGGRKALIHGNGIALQRQLSHNSYFAGDRASFDHQDEHMAEEDMDVSMDTPAAKASEMAADNFASPLALNASLVTTDDSESSIKPYDSADQLDYLEDGFQLVSLMIKTNSAKLKDDLKKEGTSNANMWHDSSADNKFSNRELSAKIKLHEKRIAARLRRTEESGQTLPRLETLMSKFEADAFEKRLVLLLIGLTVSPIVRTLVDNMKNGHPSDPTISVGDALSILCADFRSQLTHRKYFYQSSRLLRNGVISLLTSRWREGTGDLTENRLALDRRILDWSVGLDTEINELVQGSDLYQPVVQLNQVILPHGYMERILSQCYAYDEYTLYQQASADENKLSYGNSLVILLCGKSGTGKTMTVNAVAKELGKKVLLVDFQSLLSRRGQGDAEVDLKGLFREAKMSNAVLFFDECETIFRGRHVGADRTLNSLLTEMERHCGIVFLATNRPHEIDEAMHRRITMVLEYQEPSVSMRRQIWDNLLRGIQLPEAVQMNRSELESATEESQKEKTAPTLSTGVETTAAATGTSSSSPTATDALLDAPSLVNVIKREKASSVRSLTLADDVETPVLASKYALTGGFIKNAVLSATLIAMSRDKVHPVISQADLIEGSRMQMRGNLSRNVFKVIAPESRKRSLQRDLFVPEATRLVLQKILQFENTRSKIYGTWNFTAANLGNDSNGNDSANSISNSTGNVSNTTTSSSSSSSGNAIVQPQHACINLLAGSRGSGKATIFRTVASELGNRKIKYVHVAELQGDQLAHSTELFQALVLDAAILDAVIVIDGFEKILESGAEESGAGVSSLHLMLSRMMDILYSFPGCIFLLAHIDNPQNVDLKRDFASRLFSFIRMTMPPADIRGQLWRSLLPRGAPLAADLDFTALGRRFELFPVSIQAAIAYACAEVAGRTKMPSITQQDLLLAGEREVKKLRSSNFDIISGLFN